MCLHAQAESVRFLHCSLQLFESKFASNRAAAMREYGAAGKNLDVIYAIVRQQANLLPYFPRAIGFAVMQIPRQLNVWGLPSHRACATCDCDVCPGNVHARPDNIAMTNRIAQGNVGKRAVDAYVSHTGESR